MSEKKVPGEMPADLPPLKPMMATLYVMESGELGVNFHPPRDESSLSPAEQLERVRALVAHAVAAIEALGKEPEPIYIHDIERSRRVH